MSTTETAPAKSMDEIVALCKRRGFVYPASEIYGGINGFWDYGPLGVALKNNLRDRWWRDMVECPPDGPDGSPLDIVGLDSAIIQNPKVWEASGHVGGFNDPMVDDKETKQRFRADHLWGAWLIKRDAVHDDAWQEVDLASVLNLDSYAPKASIIATGIGEAVEFFVGQVSKQLKIDPIIGKIDDLFDTGQGAAAVVARNKREGGQKEVWAIKAISYEALSDRAHEIPSPFTGKAGSLTSPRQFNLMFKTYVGALQDEDATAYLRPETAQGIFTNFKNVLDTTRVKVPFGIAQIGKSFRNEVTPRNFIFRSREFEQMEMEWFCHPDDAKAWYEFWVEQRLNWWKSLGIDTTNLQRREHDDDELAHYSTACADVEYRYPFTAPGYGELEGIAHRGCYDLAQHQEHARTKLEYFDQEAQLKAKEAGLPKDEIDRRSKYLPHVIEPAAGLTRGLLVLLCEAFTPTPDRAGSSVVMKFDPSLAPVKAGIFPLVNKDGMPEVAEKLFKDVRKKYACQYDAKQSIGKRYARMDEAGTPYCFTIDGDTLADQTVTVRHRDTASQERIGIDRVIAFLDDTIE